MNDYDRPQSHSASEEGTGDPYTDELSTLKRDGLKPVNFLTYSIGHVYNDLCATAWFTYLLYFLVYVAKASEKVASLAALSG